MDSSGTYRLAHPRAAGRNNDIDNGNTAAIIASRMERVAPVQPGQRAEKSGGGIAAHRYRFLEGFAGSGAPVLPDNGRQPRP
ncbi:hypothetical protein [Burkholderia ambifaria]|uniref:hypothetical protein n=1 Tax=Burkholderia ambifaria TaxID=152480 RepID=UPI0015896CCB|nr:hypothetical protein [Burkholderia ambifaria]